MGPEKQPISEALNQMFGIVYITAGNIDNASAIAKELVAKGFAACVNMFPVSSVYRWEGKLVEDSEVAMIVKTRSENFEEICELVKKLHNYELPAIEFWEIKGDKQYLDWVFENSSKRSF